MRLLDLILQAARVTQGMLSWHVHVWGCWVYLYLYLGLLLCVLCLSVPISHAGTGFVSIPSASLFCSQSGCEGYGVCFWLLGPDL